MNTEVEKAPTLRTCPECHESLRGRSARKEAIKHYGSTPPDPRLYPLAAERYKILMEAGF